LVPVGASDAARAGQEPNAGVIRNAASRKLEIGASNPIGAVESGPQQAGVSLEKLAPDAGFGRGCAICEYDEIMQISPVRATMSAYRGIAGDSQPAKHGTSNTQN
jgi:hypothetical protein